MKAFLIGSAILIGCCLIAAGALGQSVPVSQPPQPLPPQAQPTKTEQLAISAINQQIHEVDVEFRKNHPGFHIEWSFGVAPDNAPTQPAKPEQPKK